MVALRSTVVGALGAAVAACLFFSAFAFLAASRLNMDITHARNDAAQLVRVQTIRTSLAKADANATNAFLVGGLEATAVRAGYTDGISTAARTLAEAASANSDDAAVLQRVNRVITIYTGLIESARANNRQGFPIGAAYLRQASALIQTDALPPLATLVSGQQQRVQTSTDAADSRLALLTIILIVAVVVLVVLQVWLYIKTRRVFNPSLVVASAIVIIVGLVGLGVMFWSRTQANHARDGAYAQTVALATARINAFDAKSAEALTLINRGSGQPYEDRFRAVSQTALQAIGSGGQDVAPIRQSQTVAALQQYLAQHTQVRKLDGAGSWDQAVAAATGDGAANRAFATFETVSGKALSTEANALADDLDSARLPLTTLSWILLLSGIAAAVATWRGVNQRLREYR